MLEAGIAGVIATLFLTSLFALNSNMMHLLRAGAEVANASQDLQARVEQVRLANWNQITDPNWVQGSLLNSKTSASANLPGLKETLTVASYLPPSSTPSPNPTPGPFSVVRTSDGTVTADSASSQLAQQDMVQINVNVSWPSLYRTRNRSLTTIISKWGISK